MDNDICTVILAEYRNPGVVEAVIPEGITRIGEGVFKNYTNLKNVVLPSTLREIETGAFENCISLQRLVLPKGVVFLGDSVCEGCKNLQEVVCPSTLRVIGEYAFARCEALEGIALNEGLERICRYAFAESGMKKLTIPSTCTSIGDGICRRCSQLSYVDMSLCAIETLSRLAMEDCPELRQAKLPGSLKSIESRAFGGCSNLALHIPDSVCNIAGNAFLHIGSICYSGPALDTTNQWGCDGLWFIDSFRGTYDFLSNFYPSKVTVYGLTYENNEAAFQAQKTTDPAIKAKFQTMRPAEAKEAGRKVALRKDWDFVKDSIMEDIVKAKYQQNPDLRFKLLNTNHACLVEGNTWHDNYWGSCHCPKCANEEHNNRLGAILETVRSELRSNEITVL